MEDSLGNNAKTLMFVNVSPSAYNAEETHNSLTYAALAKKITNKVPYVCVLILRWLSE